MFAKLPIRAKILAIVSMLLIVMAATGLFSMQKMQTIDDKAADIQANWLPSIRALGELRAGTINYRNVIREHMLAETAERKAEAIQKLQKAINQSEGARTLYQKLISSPEERELFAQWSKTWDEYLQGSRQVMQLSDEETGKIPLRAHELHYRTVNPISLKADELLAKAIELNNKGADQAGADAHQSYLAGFRILVAALLASAIGGIGLAVYLVRDVSNGISSIVRPMQALSSGDLSAAVQHRGEPTEIGQMADALQVFKEALIAKQAADQLAGVEAEAKIARSLRVDSITSQFETVIKEIADTVSAASSELEASASTLTTTADQSLRLADSVATGSEQASTNVQSVASATEEMSSSVNEISRQVQESAKIAAEAVEQARTTNDHVGELARAATRIGDVVALINTVAGQTNLLALNATIEAARAGEAGRGFAVVASEVKALANQTAKATEEISQQISGIQSATQDAVGAIRDIGGTIDRMSEISAAIASAVEQQGAATREISRNIQQAARGTVQVTDNIGNVQRGATETGAASGQVLASAKSLSVEGTRLKREVDSFLDSIRAA